MTAYEMRISDWSSDVCSSDLDADLGDVRRRHVPEDTEHLVLVVEKVVGDPCYGNVVGVHARLDRRLPASVDAGQHPREIDVLGDVHVEHRALVDGDRGWPVRTALDGPVGQALHEIGRASWRERVGQYV